jgi:hypothetical protein
MSESHHIIEDYFRRTGRPRDGALDAPYMYEMAVLRDLLGRLEVILEEEGVPPETVTRVIRCMIYGAPSPADAVLRMRQQERTVEMLSRMPPAPMDVSGLLGMPPR